MTVWFSILTVLFILISAAMVLIILVQRPQGGGLAGAFGGAGGAGTDTVFGGRVGDALTVMTVIAFVAYLGLAVWLNLLDPRPTAAVPTAAEISAAPEDPTGATDDAVDDLGTGSSFTPPPAPDTDPDRP